MSAGGIDAPNFQTKALMVSHNYEDYITFKGSETYTFSTFSLLARETIGTLEMITPEINF